MSHRHPVVLLALAAALLPCRATPAPGQAAKAKKQEDPRPKDPFQAPFRFNTPKGQPLDSKMEGWLRTLMRLREVYLLARDKGYDEMGRPSCGSAEFARLRSEVESMPVEKGYFWYVAHGSENKAYRRAALWRSLYLPPSKRAFQIMSLMPYEPESAIRSELLTLILPFLEKHLGRRGVAMPENVPGHVKASWNAEAAKRRFSYDFDGLAFADLIRSSSARDRILSLRVLQVLARVRKETAAALLMRIKRRIPDCLRSDKEPLRREARLLLDALDGDPPCPEEAEAAVAHFQRLLRKLFPDVRKRGGVCGLYPGPDLDRLVALVSELLAKDRLGRFTRSWELARGQKKFVWGIQLAELDASLAGLGLTEGDVLTHLNGVPLQGSEQLLELIKKELARGARTFILQWIDKKHRPHAVRYTLEKDDR